jgi:hypothetical protein
MRNKKRIINKIHRFILKTITGIAIITFLVSLFSVDGPYWWQACIGLGLSTGWLVLYCWANEDATDKKY